MLHHDLDMRLAASVYSLAMNGDVHRHLFDPPTTDVVILGARGIVA
jgi:hypothetical protein